MNDPPSDKPPLQGALFRETCDEEVKASEKSEAAPDRAAAPDLPTVQSRTGRVNRRTTDVAAESGS